MFTLHELAKQLGRNESNILIYKDIKLQDVFFLSQNKSLSTNHLYVTKASALPNYNLEEISLAVIEDIPLTQQCNLNKCNVIIFPIKTCIFELFNLVKELFTTKNEFFRQSFYLYDQLLKSKSLLDVINHGEDLLNNPIIIIDESFKVIEYSKKIPVTDEIWVKNIKNGYCSYEFVSEVNKLKTFKEAPVTDEPFAVTCHANKITKRVSKLFIDNNLRGYMIIPECNHPLSAKGLTLIPTLNKIISHQLEKTVHVHNYQELEEKLIVDLLENNIKLTEELNDRLKSCRLSIHTYKFLISISTNPGKKQRSQTTSLQTKLSDLFSNVKQLIYKDQLILLISYKTKCSIDKIKQEKFISLLKERELCGIMSDCFTDLSELHLHFIRNLKGLEIGKTLERNSVLLIYNDLKFYHFLDDFPDKTKLLNYCHPAVLKLLSYDRENNTDYYNTLLAYLLNNQNAHTTAEKLYIHRNTMKYRLKKIYELIDLDLKEGETVFQIAYSYKILTYLNE